MFHSRQDCPAGFWYAFAIPVSLALFVFNWPLPAGAAETLTHEPITPLPLPESLGLNADKVRLGERLFQDVRFSRDNSTACISCHNLKQGGADKLGQSIGVRQQSGVINSPSVLNSGLNFRQFWDGRSATLEAQIDDVVHNPAELDMDWPELVSRLAADDALVSLFKAVYPDGVQPANIQDALATFERSLVTPSRFDRYLRGETTAISTDELKGYQLFKDYGCIACHQGMNIGGNMFQKFGAVNDYFGQRGNVTKADWGRFNVTGLEEDRHVFKVPSLRNVALTSPYFHDASAQTLGEAVEIMFRHQLGRTAPEHDRQLIVDFLGSLSGEAQEVKQ